MARSPPSPLLPIAHPQDRLDPIDWATYEPHLWSNVQAAYHRTSVLLGALTQLKRAHVEASAARAAAQPPPEINTFGVLPVVPRFQYLPISAPSVAQHLAAARQRGAAGAAAPGASVVAAGATPGGGPAALALPRAGSLSGGAAGGSGALASGVRGSVAGLGATSDLAAAYSLADFGASSSTFNSRAGSAAAQGVVAAAVSPASEGGMAGLSAGAGAALGALQARLHGGVLSSAFTGMLGDSGAAAAAHNIAQNIGDLLPGGLMSGGLMSSFTKSTSSGSKR
jgi:hypothetical protein